MKRSHWQLIGVFLFMAGLWGGAFALSGMDIHDWRMFPAFITSAMVCAFGYCLALVGALP